LAEQGPLAVGQAQGILLAQIPEGFARGKGPGFEFCILSRPACLSFLDPGGFTFHHLLNLRFGGRFGGTHDQPTVKFDLQAESFPIGADPL